MAEARPGKGFLGWLGRQVGHVRKAVRTNVTPPPEVIYRSGSIEEAPHPEEPNLTLRRTTIDEVIAEKRDRQ